MGLESLMFVAKTHSFKIKHHIFCGSFKIQNNLILDRVGGYKTLAYRAGYYPGEIIHIQGETIQQAEEKNREGGYPGWRERPG